MDKPKFSEVLRAAAQGVMRPYDGISGSGGTLGQFPGGSGSGGAGPSYRIEDLSRAQQTAGMFNAIAELYEKYEQAQTYEARN